MFASAANTADLDISDNENSNGVDDSSDDDAEKNTNQSNTYEEELDPYRLENLLLDDSDDDLTDHHAGADGAPEQLINMKQDTRKSVWKAK